MKPVRTLGYPAWAIGMALACLLYSAVGLASGGTAEPPVGLGVVQPATPMPSFQLPLANGDLFDSSTLRGKVVVVRFWATW